MRLIDHVYVFGIVFPQNIKKKLDWLALKENERAPFTLV